MYPYQGQGYIQAFCSVFNCFLSKNVHIAFLSELTLPPDQGAIYEVELVSDAWYHPITQDKDDRVSIPAFLRYEKSTAPTYLQRTKG